MKKTTSKKGIKSIILWLLSMIGITITVFLVFVIILMAILIYGPSDRARDLFVVSTGETSAVYWLPNLLMSKERIDEIRAPKKAEEVKPDDYKYFTYEPDVQEKLDREELEKRQENFDDTIEIIPIKTGQYEGKLMIVHDPSRVIVGTLDRYGADCEGLFLYEFIDKYDAIGGTNAGGFYDLNGQGNGGIPEGLVINDGKILFGQENTFYNNVIGFDDKYNLKVGSKTGKAALEENIVSAVSFAPGPVLVADGVKQTGFNSSLNPRTCIGQREDGTILLLVIEGRKLTSIGASYDDLANIMLEYGAINAANLDGGSSSLMYYDNEAITSGSNIVGMRRMSTSILVLKEGR